VSVLQNMLRRICEKAMESYSLSAGECLPSQKERAMQGFSSNARSIPKQYIVFSRFRCYCNSRSGHTHMLCALVVTLHCHGASKFFVTTIATLLPPTVVAPLVFSQFPACAVATNKVALFLLRSFGVRLCNHGAALSQPCPR
jgi:hypothetical protein